MKIRTIIAACCMALLNISCQKEEVRQPNIVIIYADDMGYGDLNVQNPDSKIPTPNLDQLASEGMRFTDAHSSSGVCTPSRYALLTGRYHWRRGEGIVGSWEGSWFDKGRLTLPAMLREKGYNTACIGKWHLGWDWEAIRNVEVEDINHPDAHDWSKPVPGGPLDHGFDYYFGDDVPNFPPYTWIENDRILVPPTVPFTPVPVPTNTRDGAGRGEGHDTRPGPMVRGWRLDEVMPGLTGKAVEWIGQQSADQPFFLYWSWTAPHTPVVPVGEYHGSTGAGAYGDFMHQIDAHLGEVLQALTDNGFADNTLVIFTSDNGPESIAYARIQNHDHYSMGPLRGVKQDVWEGGHRVPFIVRWPGVVGSNTVSHELVSQIDVMGTIASLVGYTLPDNAAEDSHGFLPLLRGESDRSGRETLVHRTWKEPWGIRHGDWVYINAPTGSVQKEPEWRGYPPNPHEDWLNNIREDPGQEKNLVREYPERAESLRNKLESIRESSSTAPRYGQITPPMGWNSWNEFRFNVSENLIIETADAMKMQKLDEAGYKYIVIDDGWQAETLASDGSLMADPTKFPNGIAFLSNYVKRLGFELGIYSSPNVLTCGGYPGSLGFEKLHVKQFDNWGVKFLKYDYCPTRNNEQENSSEIILERIRTMHSALSEINSNIIYAICEKGWVSGQIRYAENYREQIVVTPDNRKDLFAWAPELGTMWRTTADIAPRWSKIMDILDKQEGLAVLSGPGSFNDPDMLEVGNGELTYSENRAHFSLWCILAAPLFLGNDVRNMDDEILEIITNKELIALNQDKLCKQAEKVYDNGDIEIFLKPLENSDVGVCILNRASTVQQFEMDWEYIDIDVKEEVWSIRDLWAHKNLKMTPNSLTVEIKPHDVRVFRLSCA